MSNIKEFAQNPISIATFWGFSGPPAVLSGMLIAVLVIWKRPIVIMFRSWLKAKLMWGIRANEYEL